MSKEEKLYTEEELKSLITEAFDYAFTSGYHDEQYIFVDGEKISNDANYWIEQNLKTKTKMKIEHLINDTYQVTDGSSVFYQGKLSDCKIFISLWTV